MEALINTQKEVVWFHKITEPVLELLSKRIITVEKDSGKKLFFPKFVTLLLYFYLQGIDSLRSLVTTLKTDNCKATPNIPCTSTRRIQRAWQICHIRRFCLPNGYS